MCKSGNITTDLFILVKVSHLMPSPHSQYVCFAVKNVVRRASALSWNTHPLLFREPSIICFSKSSIGSQMCRGGRPVFTIVRYFLFSRGLRNPSVWQVAELAARTQYAELNTYSMFLDSSLKSPSSPCMMQIESIHRYLTLRARAMVIAFWNVTGSLSNSILRWWSLQRLFISIQ